MISHRVVIRLVYLSLLLAAIVSAVTVVLILKSKQLAFEQSSFATSATDGGLVTPFPISVDPINEIITESELATVPPELLSTNTHRGEGSWWQRLFAALVQQSWYQNVATPVSRVVVIWPGERKEEAAKNIGDVLRWNADDRARFIELVTTNEPILNEGTFYPDQYITHRYATPEEMANLVNVKFADEILSRYSDDVAALVPLSDALTIASLLEREASDFENMREIAGVIWNRLFINMPLQLDATLQYARGSRSYEPEWWPVPRPRDKFIDSPYNTYSNEGLPPAPIANPSRASIIAALNPIQTDCLFYFHGPDQSYYCSETYDEHVEKLQVAYGL
jgi:hypothetical protein